MRRRCSIARIVAVWLLHVVLITSGTAQSFVKLQGRNFMLNGQAFYPVVMNYNAEIVSNVDNSPSPVELYYSPASHYDASPYGHFEFSDSAGCRVQLVEHFAKIASMGFNTLRLNQCVIMSEDGPGGQRHYKIEVRYNQSGEWPTSYRLDLDLGTFTNNVALRYFQLLRRIIGLANAAGLKTILVCAEDAGGWNQPNQLTLAEDVEAVDLYASYLARLAEEMKDEPGLVAYDLWNEPRWTAQHLLDWDKADICDFTGRWYDAIRGPDEAPRDRNHLITFGGCAYHEITTWDPAVMKLDFYSPHIYPGLLTLDDYDLQTAHERLKAELYWLGADCPMPWLIGETGFVADDDKWDPLDASGQPPNHDHLHPDPVYHVMPWMQGSEQDQANFAAMSLDAVRNYGGSGYSWWDFQNNRDVSIPYVQSQYPDEPGKWLQGNFLALLHFGNDVPLLPNPNLPEAPPEWIETHPWRDKEVVDIFTDYDPGEAPTGLPASPTNYYSWLGAGGDVVKQYTLEDQNGEPVANGLATVVWFYHTANPADLPDTGKDFWDRNVADVNGLCTISVVDEPGTDYEDPAPRTLFIHATGAGELSYNEEEGIPWPEDGSIIPVVRRRLFFEDIISDLVVGVGENEDAKAWSKLTVEDVSILGTGSVGGVADFRSRDEVHVVSEFHAQAGSEVHLFTEPTFLDCGSEVIGMAQQGGSTRHTAQKEAEQHHIRRLMLSFDEPHLFVSAYPNPCTTQLRVTLSAGTGILTAHDAQGALVLTDRIGPEGMILDVEAWSSGEYTLKVAAAGLEHIAKVTKN